MDWGTCEQTLTTPQERSMSFSHMSHANGSMRIWLNKKTLSCSQCSQKMTTLHNNATKSKIRESVL
jgi:hypothetical protein